MSLSRLIHVGVVVLTSVPLAVAASSPATGAAPQTQPVASTGQDSWQTYRESCRQILNGDFSEGYETLQQVLDEQGDTPNIAQLKGWMDQYQDLSDLRTRLHDKEYQVYVKRAQDHAAKGEWSKAMDSLASAFWTTASEDEFRKEAWLKDFVEKASTHAEDLRKRGEWTDATRIYAELALIWQDNQTYKDLRTRCAAHANLEATYNDADWKDRLAGVTLAMAQDAFGRIDKYYYSIPDLKKMGGDAIERLTVLAETSALFKTFSGLNSPESRQRFIARLNGLSSVLDRQDTVSAAELTTTLNEVLKANRETVALPSEVVISEYVNGAFDALDRYSSMIWPAEQAEFRKHTTGEFFGVGIQISMENDRIKVFSPLEDTPAYRAGIEPGDTILRIDEKPVKGITLEQAVRRITGPSGSPVTLKIDRAGVADPFDVTMKRTKITVPTVKGWEREGTGWSATSSTSRARSRTCGW